MSKSWKWIEARAKDYLIHDGEEKLWELRKITLSQQPGTESSARQLQESFRKTVDAIEDKIRTLQGKEKKEDLLDGEMIYIA